MKISIAVLKYLPAVFILLSVFAAPVYSQVDNIPADNPVYSFLKEMQVRGILKDYDDVVLPLSREKVSNALLKIDSLKDKLTGPEQEYLRIEKEKFGLNTENSNNPVQIFDGFPSRFIGSLFSNKEKHLYSYRDSLINFVIDPVFDADYIYSSGLKNNSYLINFGGLARGSYDGWLGFYVKGENGSVYGSREAALLDKRVRQSYTFNKTDINYFDNTSGYIRVKKGIVNLELGRERILWGNGYIDRTILSDNPQLFDFVKFGISYKKFSYDFIHGWLVQPAVNTFIDSLVGNIRSKQSKYIAVSRMGYQANERLSFGLTQMIIYGDRPFEAAYLNPFLFWESAQRSMNDLDNSFLAFDGRYRAADGMEFSASMIFDDINFSWLSKGEWTRYNNGNEWQAGVMLANPFMPENMTLKVEYLQIRPYTFSHPGVGEALTYTNNGYLLGTDLQPNSTRFSAELNYRLSGRADATIRYSRSLHGANIYDTQGNVVVNVGGDVFRNFTQAYDAQYVSLLAGNVETSDLLLVNFNYEMVNGFFLNITYRMSREAMNGAETTDNSLFAVLKIDFE